MKYKSLTNKEKKETSERKINKMLKGYTHIDWKEPINDVLYIFDKLLKKHKLELTTIDIGDDAYHFKIDIKQ